LSREDKLKILRVKACPDQYFQPDPTIAIVEEQLLHILRNTILAVGTAFLRRIAGVICSPEQKNKLLNPLLEAESKLSERGQTLRSRLANAVNFGTAFHKSLKDVHRQLLWFECSGGSARTVKTCNEYLKIASEEYNVFKPVLRALKKLAAHDIDLLKIMENLINLEVQCKTDKDLMRPYIFWSGEMSPGSGEVVKKKTGETLEVSAGAYVHHGTPEFFVDSDGSFDKEKMLSFINSYFAAQIWINKYDAKRQACGKPLPVDMIFTGLGGKGRHDYIFNGTFTPRDPGIYKITTRFYLKRYPNEPLPEDLDLWDWPILLNSGPVKVPSGEMMGKKIGNYFGDAILIASSSPVGAVVGMRLELDYLRINQLILKVGGRNVPQLDRLFGELFRLLRIRGGFGDVTWAGVKAAIHKRTAVPQEITERYRSIEILIEKYLERQVKPGREQLRLFPGKTAGSPVSAQGLFRQEAYPKVTEEANGKITVMMGVYRSKAGTAVLEQVPQTRTLYRWHRILDQIFTSLIKEGRVMREIAETLAEPEQFTLEKANSLIKLFKGVKDEEKKSCRLKLELARSLFSIGDDQSVKLTLESLVAARRFIKLRVAEINAELIALQRLRLSLRKIGEQRFNRVAGRAGLIQEMLAAGSIWEAFWRLEEFIRFPYLNAPEFKGVRYQILRSGEIIDPLNKRAGKDIPRHMEMIIEIVNESRQVGRFMAVYTGEALRRLKAGAISSFADEGTFEGLFAEWSKDKQLIRAGPVYRRAKLYEAVFISESSAVFAACDLILAVINVPNIWKLKSYLQKHKLEKTLLVIAVFFNGEIKITCASQVPVEKRKDFLEGLLSAARADFDLDTKSTPEEIRHLYRAFGLENSSSPAESSSLPRVLLINPPGVATDKKTETYLWVPLNILHLASYLIDKGVNVQAIDLCVSTEQEFNEQIERFKPDIAGITAMTPTLPSVLDISDTLKKRFPEIRIILGGSHPSISPEDTLGSNSVDYVVIGEGIITFYELIESLTTKNDISSIEGIAYRDLENKVRLTSPRKLIDNLDEFPFFAYDLLSLEPYFQYTQEKMGERLIEMIVSQGCPYKCRYCAVTKIQGAKQRMYSPQRVIDELRRLKEQYNCTGVWFKDSILTLNMEWLEEFAEMLIKEKLGIKWFAHARVDNFKRNLDVISLLRKSGAAQFWMGIETGSPRIAETLNRPFLGDEESEKILGRIHDAGIGIGLYYMIGLPGEKVEDVRQTFYLARRFQSLLNAETHLHIFNPFPGNSIYDELLNNGLINFTDFKQMSFHTAVIPTGVGPEYLTSEQIQYYFDRICAYFRGETKEDPFEMAFVNNWSSIDGAASLIHSSSPFSFVESAASSPVEEREKRIRNNICELLARWGGRIKSDFTARHKPGLFPAPKTRAQIVSFEQYRSRRGSGKASSPAETGSGVSLWGASPRFSLSSSPAERSSAGSFKKMLRQLSHNGRWIRLCQWGWNDERRLHLFIYTFMSLGGVITFALTLAFISGVPLLVVLALPIHIIVAFLGTAVSGMWKLWVGFAILLAAVSLLFIRSINGARSLLIGAAGWLADFILLLWPRNFLHTWRIRLQLAALAMAVSSLVFIGLESLGDKVKDSYLNYAARSIGAPVSLGKVMRFNSVRTTERSGRESAEHYLAADWQWGRMSLLGDIVVRGESSRRNLEDNLRRPYDSGFESQNYIIIPERVGSQHPFAYGRTGENNGRSAKAAISGEPGSFTIYYRDAFGNPAYPGRVNQFNRQKVKKDKEGSSYTIKDAVSRQPGSSSPALSFSSPPSILTPLRNSKGESLAQVMARFMDDWKDWPAEARPFRIFSVAFVDYNTGEIRCIPLIDFIVMLARREQMKFYPPCMLNQADRVFRLGAEAFGQEAARFFKRQGFVLEESLLWLLDKMSEELVSFIEYPRTRLEVLLCGVSPFLDSGYSAKLNIITEHLCQYNIYMDDFLYRWGAFDGEKIGAFAASSPVEARQSSAERGSSPARFRDEQKLEENSGGSYERTIEHILLKRAIYRKQRLLLSDSGYLFKKVFLICGTCLVEKWLRDGESISARARNELKIARERLNGVGAKIFIHSNRVIQEFVEVLGDSDEPSFGLLYRVLPDEGEMLIDRYFEAILAEWSRGVFNRDFYLFNYGRNLEGEVVLFDYSRISDTYPQNLRVLTRLRDKLFGIANMRYVPPWLRDYYLDATYNFIYEFEAEFLGYPEKQLYWQKGINEGVVFGNMDFPHPYPPEGCMISPAPLVEKKAKRLKEYKRAMEGKSSGGPAVLTPRSSSPAEADNLIKEIAAIKDPSQLTDKLVTEILLKEMCWLLEEYKKNPNFIIGYGPNWRKYWTLRSNYQIKPFLSNALTNKYREVFLIIEKELQSEGLKVQSISPVEYYEMCKRLLSAENNNAASSVRAPLTETWECRKRSYKKRDWGYVSYYHYYNPQRELVFSKSIPPSRTGRIRIHNPDEYKRYMELVEHSLVSHNIVVSSSPAEAVEYTRIIVSPQNAQRWQGYLSCGNKFFPGEFNIFKDGSEQPLAQILSFMERNYRSPPVRMAKVNVAPFLADTFKTKMIKHTDYFGGFKRSDPRHQLTSTSCNPTNSKGLVWGCSTSKQSWIASLILSNKTGIDLPCEWQPRRDGTVATKRPSSSRSISTKNWFLRIYPPYTCENNNLYFSECQAENWVLTFILQKASSPAENSQPGRLDGLTAIDQLSDDPEQLKKWSANIQQISPAHLNRVLNAAQRFGDEDLARLYGYVARPVDYSRFLGLLKRHVFPFGNKRLLEIGPGSAFFLLGLKEGGVQIEGLEHNPELAQLAQQAGLMVWEGDLLTPPQMMLECPYDATFSHFVLDVSAIKQARNYFQGRNFMTSELQNEGVRILGQLAELTRPGGVSIHEISSAKFWPFTKEDIAQAGFKILEGGIGENFLVFQTSSRPQPFVESGLSCGASSPVKTGSGVSLWGASPKVVVIGMGRDGISHAARMLREGTNIVAGVAPGRGGQFVVGIPDGSSKIPIYNTIKEAVEKTKADTAIIFVPAPSAAKTIIDAAKAGIKLVVAITEGIPVIDMLKVTAELERDYPKVRLIGPNCPGIIRPGQSKVGIMPAHIFAPGNVGIVSRSGTLTYEVANGITIFGWGQSIVAGIGGDPVIGMSFVDVLKFLEDDLQTKAIVLIGEIGGSAEEEAAEYIKMHVKKPVIAIIAGRNAPAGKRMGHAGAIISGGKGGTEEKIAALKQAGVQVVDTPDEVAQKIDEIARQAGWQKSKARLTKVELEKVYIDECGNPSAKKPVKPEKKPLKSFSKIHEFEASAILKEFGIPVTSGKIALIAEEAGQFAEEIGGPVVIKAQVHSGGRGKKGFIKIAKSAREAEETAGEMLGKTLNGLPVNKVMVVPAIEKTKEIYVGITIDRSAKKPVLIVSPQGGVDIESVAKTNPELIYKLPINFLDGLQDKDARQLAGKIFDNEKLINGLIQIFQAAYRAFMEKDLSLVEINPLVVTREGKLLALDTKINLDENALFRRLEFQEFFDGSQVEPREITAKEEGLSYIDLGGGNIGCMVNGAGLAMLTLDIIGLFGGKAANFLDAGGSSNPKKVLEAFKLLLSKAPRVILVNIFGGITRCDDIAKGIITARNELNISLPMVIRLSGTNEEEGRRILEEAGLGDFVLSTMNAAIKEAVRLAARQEELEEMAADAFSGFAAFCGDEIKLMRAELEVGKGEDFKPALHGANLHTYIKENLSEDELSGLGQLIHKLFCDPLGFLTFNFYRYIRYEKEERIKDKALHTFYKLESNLEELMKLVSAGRLLEAEKAILSSKQSILKSSLVLNPSLNADKGGDTAASPGGYSSSPAETGSGVSLWGASPRFSMELFKKTWLKRKVRPRDFVFWTGDTFKVLAASGKLLPLLEEIFNQIDKKAENTNKALAYYINAAQRIDTDFLVRIIAGYIDQQNYQGFKVYLIVTNILLEALQDLERQLASLKKEYQGFFELCYAVLPLANEDEGLVSKFIFDVNLYFGGLDGIMCNLGLVSSYSYGNYKIIPRLPGMLKNGGWLQVDAFGYRNELEKEFPDLTKFRDISRWEENCLLFDYAGGSSSSPAGKKGAPGLINNGRGVKKLTAKRKWLKKVWESFPAVDWISFIRQMRICGYINENEAAALDFAFRHKVISVSGLDGPLSELKGVHKCSVTRWLLGRSEKIKDKDGAYKRLGFLIWRKKSYAAIRVGLRGKLGDAITRDFARFVVANIRTGKIGGIARSVLDAWPLDKRALRRKAIFEYFSERPESTNADAAADMGMSRSNLVKRWRYLNEEFIGVARRAGFFEELLNSLVEAEEEDALSHLCGSLLEFELQMRPLFRHFSRYARLDSLLPEDVARLIEMRLFKGCSYALLAKKFGFAESTINRFFEGRKRKTQDFIFCRQGAIQKFAVYLEDMVTRDMERQLYSDLDKYGPAKREEVLNSGRERWLFLKQQYGLAFAAFGRTLDAFEGYSPARGVSSPVETICIGFPEELDGLIRSGKMNIQEAGIEIHQARFSWGSWTARDVHGLVEVLVEWILSQKEVISLAYWKDGLKFALREAIDNAFAHSGVAEGRVKVIWSIRDDRLIFEVIDEGKRKFDLAAKSSGLRITDQFSDPFAAGLNIGTKAIRKEMESAYAAPIYDNSGKHSGNTVVMIKSIRDNGEASFPVLLY